MAQAAAIYGYLSLSVSERNKIFYLIGFDKCRFKGMIKPGDQVIYKVKPERSKGILFRASGRAYVNEVLVAEAKLTAVAR